jgi:endonuclease III
MPSLEVTSVTSGEDDGSANEDKDDGSANEDAATVQLEVPKRKKKSKTSEKAVAVGELLVPDGVLHRAVMEEMALQKLRAQKQASLNDAKHDNPTAPGPPGTKNVRALVVRKPNVLTEDDEEENDSLIDEFMTKENIADAAFILNATTPPDSVWQERYSYFLSFCKSMHICPFMCCLSTRTETATTPSGFLLKHGWKVPKLGTPPKWLEDLLKKHYEPVQVDLNLQRNNAIMRQSYHKDKALTCVLQKQETEYTRARNSAVLTRRLLWSAWNVEKDADKTDKRLECMSRLVNMFGHIENRKEFDRLFKEYIEGQTVLRMMESFQALPPTPNNFYDETNVEEDEEEPEEPEEGSKKKKDTKKPAAAALNAAGAVSTTNPTTISATEELAMSKMSLGVNPELVTAAQSHPTNKPQPRDYLEELTRPNSQKAAEVLKFIEFGDPVLVQLLSNIQEKCKLERNPSSFFHCVRGCVSPSMDSIYLRHTKRGSEGSDEVDLTRPSLVREGNVQLKYLPGGEDFIRASLDMVQLLSIFVHSCDWNSCRANRWYWEYWLMSSLGLAEECSPKLRATAMFVCLFISGAARDNKAIEGVLALKSANLLDIHALAGADLATIANCLKTVGIQNVRAMQLQETCRTIRDDHGGEIPWREKELLALKGVGPKMKGVFMTECFGVWNSIGSDTWVTATATSLGWLPGWQDLPAESLPVHAEAVVRTFVPVWMYREINRTFGTFCQMFTQILPLGKVTVEAKDLARISNSIREHIHKSYHLELFFYMVRAFRLSEIDRRAMKKLATKQNLGVTVPALAPAIGGALEPSCQASQPVKQSENRTVPAVAVKHSKNRTVPAVPVTPEKKKKPEPTRHSWSVTRQPEFQAHPADDKKKRNKREEKRERKNKRKNKKRKQSD